MQLWGIQVYPRPAERAAGGFIGIRRRIGQGFGSGFFLIDAAEGDAAGAAAYWIGADFDGFFGCLPGGIDEFCRYGLAFEFQIVKSVSRHGIYLSASIRNYSCRFIIIEVLFKCPINVSTFWCESKGIQMRWMDSGATLVKFKSNQFKISHKIQTFQ